MCEPSIIKRLFVLIGVWVTVLGFICVDIASASPRFSFRMPLYLADAAPIEKDLMTHLKTEILPQIEQILSPDQREQLQTSIADGMSFRKAFKSMMLTPEQKTQIKTVLKSAIKKDAFASLTPE